MKRITVTTYVSAQLAAGKTPPDIICDTPYAEGETRRAITIALSSKEVPNGQVQ